MCRTDKKIYGCGKHYKQDIDYCPKATTNPVTGRKVKCTEKSSTHLTRIEGLCETSSSCPWRAHNGKWRCCTCEQGPNTTGTCIMNVKKDGQNEMCNHDCCYACRPWIGR
ncbi:hypothetical protein BDV33DRAFT_184612 [Aspergillus novoparasiticus]|uniref:Uncharacterized protein n=1 Tax=Aspergillus novoparasiticus TaxID=986946 RepID=A0A5N6E886_9EURO|nr:hypothetical protein BDV33DRAFT_184612 [Aspergillus novoparasiticus]